MNDSTARSRADSHLYSASPTPPQPLQFHTKQPHHPTMPLFTPPRCGHVLHRRDPDTQRTRNFHKTRISSTWKSYRPRIQSRPGPPANLPRPPRAPTISGSQSRPLDAMDRSYQGGNNTASSPGLALGLRTVTCKMTTTNPREQYRIGGASACWRGREG